MKALVPGRDFLWCRNKNKNKVPIASWQYQLNFESLFNLYCCIRGKLIVAVHIVT